MSFSLHCMVLHSIKLLSIPFHLKWKGPICSLLEASLEAWRWSFYSTVFLFDTVQAQNPRRHLRFGGCGGIQRLSRCSGRIFGQQTAEASHQKIFGCGTKTCKRFMGPNWEPLRKIVLETSAHHLMWQLDLFEWCYFWNLLRESCWQFLISPKSG